MIPRILNPKTMKSKFSTCSGPSMYPTLIAGDGLKLEPYRNVSEVRVGDVISYPYPGRPYDVVHRIIKLSADDVITRGDNNNKIDPYVIPYYEIIGKVIATKRKTRLIAIKGGGIGLCIHKVMLFRKYFMQYGLAPLRFLSNILASSNLLTIFHPLLKTRVINIKRNGQKTKLLVIGKNAIGKQVDNSENWQIRFPYKYFIDKNRIDR